MPVAKGMGSNDCLNSSGTFWKWRLSTKLHRWDSAFKRERGCSGVNQPTLTTKLNPERLLGCDSSALSIPYNIPHRIE